MNKRTLLISIGILIAVMIIIIIGLVIFWQTKVKPNKNNYFAMTSKSLINAGILSSDYPSFLKEDPLHIRPEEGVMFPTTSPVTFTLTNKNKNIKYLMTCVILNKKECPTGPCVYNEVENFKIPINSKFFVMFSKNVNKDLDQESGDPLPIEEYSDLIEIPIYPSDFDIIKPMLKIE